MTVFLEAVADIVKSACAEINFTLLEIGAVKIGEEKEPFYELIDYFPSTRIIGFEIERDVCEEMNASARDGVTYYPHALGEFNEERVLYVTNHPMCCSLYKPNEHLNSLYQNFEIAGLKSQSTVKTITLDHFVEMYDVGEVDFIKIDIQGAELDVFKGGKKVLENVLKIVSEVEFIPIYESQPLFGDVCDFLNSYDMMFNKFLGVGGRSLKPTIIKNSINFPSQHIWSDAVFIKNVQKIPKLNNDKLLKLGLLAAVYGSPDLTYYCLAQFDERNATSLAQNLAQKTKS